MTYPIHVTFEWDPAKNADNQANHGLSFEEASQLFAAGRNYLELFDAARSDDEDRFIAIGAIDRGVIVVVWTEREEESVRIISARLATSHECTLHATHMEQCRDE